MSEAVAQAVLEEAFAYWINPEIERRREAGGITDDFTLFGAQIIFHADGEQPEVRLNEQVRAIALVRAARSLAKGEQVTHQDIDTFEDIELTDADPDAGHITVVFGHPTGYVVSFDLRYNASRIADHIDAADEFLQTASAAGARLPRAFVENLWAALELMAKAFLIVLPDPKLLSTKSHGVIHARFNQWRKLGNVDEEYVELFNRVSKMRRSARYVTGRVTATSSEIEDMLSTARRMLDRLREASPKRRAAGEQSPLPTTETD